jgi:hypothetical protein
MDQCSDYIRKLEVYRRKLNPNGDHGKMNDLVTAVKSKEFIENELKEFYTTLTRPFTTLSQLHPGIFRPISRSRQHPIKEGNCSIQNLRIFALIRLGIRIAQNICFPSLFCID